MSTNIFITVISQSKTTSFNNNSNIELNRFGYVDCEFFVRATISSSTPAELLMYYIVEM